MTTLQRSTALPNKGRGSRRLKLTTALVALAVAVAGLASPAAAGSRDVVREQLGVGLFYGTFNEGPNTVLLVGGDAQDFCKVADRDDVDPFDAEPGTAPGRTVVSSDGTVKITIKDRGQPAYFYEISGDFQGSPDWIGQVCSGRVDTPEPFATGTAKLKSRVVISPGGVLDIFNSVKGKAVGPDGARYKFRASADFVITADGDLEPPNPADFLKFSLTRIGCY